MQAERTRYAVAGWGEGELWTASEVVLAHDFSFGLLGSVSDTEGGDSPATDPADTCSVVASARRSPSSYADSTCGRNGAELRSVSLDTKRCLTPGELVALVRAFLDGDDVPLADVPLDLSATTSFEHAVLDALRSVPRGEVVTYGELAALAGHPGAQRAVGTVCARNRFAFLVPCHRVVAESGIGGYGSAGVAVKRRLLALEGVDL